MCTGEQINYQLWLREFRNIFNNSFYSMERLVIVKQTVGNCWLPVPTHATPHPPIHLKLGVVKPVTFLRHITAKRINQEKFCCTVHCNSVVLSHSPWPGAFVHMSLSGFRSSAGGGSPVHSSDKGRATARHVRPCGTSTVTPSGSLSHTRRISRPSDEPPRVSSALPFCQISLHILNT